MHTLAERIKLLRGSRNFVEFAEVTGVNRQTLKDIEDGKSVLVDTLKKIATACDVDSGRWMSILISWIRLQIGDEDFRKLDIRPAMPQREYGDPTLFADVIDYLFRQLKSCDQVEIFKAMIRPPVRECLTTINHLFERRSGPGNLLTLCEPCHTMIDSQDKLERILQKLQEGDESLFACSKEIANEGDSSARASLPSHPVKKRLAGQRRRR